jgi:hypothetical protein
MKEMEIFHFLPTRQVNSQAYDIITANIPIEALISQRDISKGMGLLDFAAQLRISTKMTNN